MTLSLDKIVAGLERTASEMPSLLAEWDDFDPELREEYTDQLLWILSARSDMIAQAQSAERFIEVAQRVAAATAALFDLREDIGTKMGIPPSCIVPYVTYTSSTETQPYAMAI